MTPGLVAREMMGLGGKKKMNSECEAGKGVQFVFVLNRSVCETHRSKCPEGS